jgi:predicted component of viral defense system (DUF524 family)
MYGIGEVKQLRDKIEDMQKIHQVQVLEICKRYEVQYTENVNGIFINMTLLDDNTLNAIQEYLAYISLQQKQLDNIEDMKKKYKDAFYNKDKVLS